MLLKLGALLLLAAAAHSDDDNDYPGTIAQYPYHSTQERPNGEENTPGCYISDLDKVIPFNLDYYPDQKDDLPFYMKCAKYTCESETWNGYQFGCRYIHDRKKKGCKVIEGKKSEKYPACCDRQVCDDSAQ